MTTKQLIKWLEQWPETVHIGVFAGPWEGKECENAIAVENVDGEYVGVLEIGT